MKIMNRETLFIIKAGYNAETEWRNDLANFRLLILRHPLHRTLTQNSSWGPEKVFEPDFCMTTRQSIFYTNCSNLKNDKKRQLEDPHRKQSDTSITPKLIINKYFHFGRQIVKTFTFRHEGTGKAHQSAQREHSGSGIVMLSPNATYRMLRRTFPSWRILKNWFSVVASWK